MFTFEKLGKKMDYFFCFWVETQIRNKIEDNIEEKKLKTKEEIKNSVKDFV